MSELSRHVHPHPYVLSQLQPYYGSRSQYPTVSQSDWDDTHYRWPSPSLPPTLKKSQNKSHFGTLDKGDLMRHTSPDKSGLSGSGRINYGFSRGSPDGDFDVESSTNTHSNPRHPDQFSTSSTNDSDDMTIDDFGDVVKRRKSSSQSSAKSRNVGQKSRTIVRQSTDEEDDDEDGWTTEF